MMGRWGLEGMKSFEQADLAREEGARLRSELEDTIPVDWPTPHKRFDFTYIWYRFWKPHVSISVSPDSRNPNTLNVANQNPSVKPYAPSAASSIRILLLARSDICSPERKVDPSVSPAIFSDPAAGLACLDHWEVSYLSVVRINQ